jgi:hypothetical protein
LIRKVVLTVAENEREGFVPEAIVEGSGQTLQRWRIPEVATRQRREAG